MTRARHPSALLWLLLAAALFMRAFVPAGYMAERSKTGTIAVRICGSGHVLEIPAGKGDAPAGSERAAPPCAFAGFGAPMLPLPAAIDLPLPEPAERACARAIHEAPRLVAALPHPPARGPPLPA